LKVLRAEPGPIVANPTALPPPGAPEVAFLGRSNVGKSTLLNRLVNRKRLAHTSSTPGKTRLIHFYRVERSLDQLWFVDLPGYGYAKVSRKERKGWKPLVEGYLDGQRPLALAVLLQDIRRTPGEDEHLLLAWLRERDIPGVVAVTKADKLKPSQRGKALRALTEAFQLDRKHFVPTSGQSGEGIDQLWKAIDASLRDGSA